MATTTRGADLKIGNVIEVWWSPKRDTIVEMHPYRGPLEYLFPKGAQIAIFAQFKCGMTIDNDDVYEVIDVMPLLVTGGPTQTRALLAARKERCATSCKGWAIFEVNEDTPGGIAIQRCDECAILLRDQTGIEISDDDVALLGEARQAMSGQLKHAARKIRRDIDRGILLPESLDEVRDIERHRVQFRRRA